MVTTARAVGFGPGSNQHSERPVPYSGMYIGRDDDDEDISVVAG